MNQRPSLRCSCLLLNAIFLVTAMDVAYAAQTQPTTRPTTAPAIAWYGKLQPEFDAIIGEMGEDSIDHLVPNSYTDPRVSREDAYKALLTTKTLAGSTVEAGGRTSGQAWAFRRILNEPDARDAFADLLHRGQMAGRLYALCGLYLLDPPEFARQVQPYRTNREEVNTFFGCLFGPKPVCDLIHKEYKNGQVWGIADGDLPRELKGR
jgi:hypothetical protein